MKFYRAYVFKEQSILIKTHSLNNNAGQNKEVTQNIRVHCSEKKMSHAARMSIKFDVYASDDISWQIKLRPDFKLFSFVRKKYFFMFFYFQCFYFKGCIIELDVRLT